MPEDDWDWQKELQRSEARLGAMGKPVDNKTRAGRDDSDGSDSDSDESLPGWEWHAFPADSALESILRGVCKVIDRVQTQGHSDRTAIVQKADELINRGVTAAYTGKTGVRIDYMPSFADMKGTLVEDTLPSYEKGRLRHPNHYRSYNVTRKYWRPWKKAQQPHPQSTLMSRFRQNVDLPSHDTHPRASVLWNALCEVSAESICLPIAACVAPDGSAAAVLSKSGIEYDSTVLQWWFDDKEYKEWARRSTSPPMFTTGKTLELDASRKLIFIGDAFSVKSFSWEGGKMRPTHVHTLDSRRYRGPLALLPGGRVLRAGKGAALLWNIDDVEPRDPKVKEARLYEDSSSSSGSEREMPNEIPIGARAHATVPFTDKGFKPRAWHLHRPTGHMLCGEDDDIGYHCLSLDLEHGGAVVNRYLGHGARIEQFSTSDGDPNIFLTACADGYARLYDVRTPLPNLTLDSERRESQCPTAVLVHLDGLPGVFTGGRISEGIKFWDVRAKKCVYELSTGNNSVAALAWDPKNSILHAATVCAYQDLHGYHHGYRRAARVKRRDDIQEGIGGADVHLWPEDAVHDEFSFGYMYDAGAHSLLRYSFKNNASQSVIPDYGQARMQGLESPTDSEEDDSA